MLNIAKGQRARIFKIEDRGNYSLVTFSTWRKDKRDDTYKYSNWGFTRFVGDAHKKLVNVSEGDKILLEGAGISREEYRDNDGERAWPKQPQVVVFNFKLIDDDYSNEDFSEPEVEDDSGDDFPF